MLIKFCLYVFKNEHIYHLQHINQMYFTIIYEQEAENPLKISTYKLHCKRR